MKHLIFFLVLSFIQLVAQTVVPISSIRTNNANGVPVDTGRTFTVRGVVTSANQFGLSGPASLQDSTGGLSVFGDLFSNRVRIGDSVQVTSVLTHFNGLTQFDFRRAGSTFQRLDSNKISIPQVVTIADINTQLWNGIEAHESKLVRLNSVTIVGTGNFASGTNYNITDASGTMQLRIDNDVASLINTPIPSGPIDVIGIIGQFKTTAPFSTGYQILPRFVSDLIYNGPPAILDPIAVSNITSTSFIVSFSTMRAGDAQIKYGLTSNLELDSLRIIEDTTFHKFLISGLNPSTQYFFRVSSTNQFGTSTSAIQTVTTASLNPVTGAINVYFNFPVDTSVAIPRNSAQGNVSLAAKLIQRINAASFSIDMALYSFFGLNDVATALIAARNRGVRIRFVYDSRANQDNVTQLVNAGVLLSKRPSSLDGIMHNKFFVFDSRDGDPNNDWIWTGSWNVTSLEVGWENNVIEINDPAIAEAYEIEFEEMWGSSTDVPNSALARFGPHKRDNTPHSFNVGGRSVKLYFSPSDQTTARIIDAINTSNSNIYFALLSFTRSDIRQAMFDRSQLGVTDQRGIIHQSNDPFSQFTNLRTFAEVFPNAGPTLHHKYAIVDATNAQSRPTLITGSHNWSNAANNDNDENTLIIEDVFLANQYMQEFKSRYNEAGGTRTFTIPTVSVGGEFSQDLNYKLHQNYPNPFNPSTTIRIEIDKAQQVEIELLNILGEKIASIFEGHLQAGTTALHFNSSELNLSSGVYFYRLKGAGRFQTMKMILMK